MSDETERQVESEEKDADFAALLRAVARPAAPASEIAARLRLAPNLGVHSSDLAEAARTAADAAPEPSNGDVLEQHYRIERVLGRGGMGVVYAAENLRTGKRVALKWMRAQRAISEERTRAAVQRFLREARAAACVRHPNVVDLYDVGGSDGAPFLVLELLEGETLRARLKRSRTSWDEAVATMLPVLAGVGAMHRSGVIHRDLKPDNIFLGDQEGSLSPFPKVLDFGVAAMQSASEDGLASLTCSGAMLGTPAYMALEQLTGKTVDERTDLYSLGVVLYEMVTGHLPFDARSAGDLAVLQATKQPAPASRHGVHVHPHHEAILLKALARDPKERFQSAGEFAAALAAQPAPRSSATRFVLVSVGAALIAMVLLYAVLRQDVRRASQLASPAPEQSPPPGPAITPSADDLAKSSGRSREEAPVADETEPSSIDTPASQAEVEVRTETVAPPRPARRAKAKPSDRPRVDFPKEATAPAPDPTKLRAEDF